MIERMDYNGVNFRVLPCCDRLGPGDSEGRFICCHCSRAWRRVGAQWEEIEHISCDPDFDQPPSYPRIEIEPAYGEMVQARYLLGRHATVAGACARTASEALLHLVAQTQILRIDFPKFWLGERNGDR